MIVRTALALAAAALPAAALAAPYADLAAIDQEVAAFTGAAQGQPGGAALPVDRRLRLAACAAPLALDWHTQRRNTVLVQCSDANGWRLFLPVIAAQGPQAAVAPAIARGDAVIIAVTGEGFAVSQGGEALEPGAVGSWIRVRGARGATASSAELRGRVVRPGLVEVPVP